MKSLKLTSAKLRSKIETETAELLRKREVEFVSQQKSSQKVLNELREQIVESRAEVMDLKEKKNELDNLLLAKQVDLESSVKAVQFQQRKLDSLKAEYEQAMGTFKELDSKYNMMEGSIGQLGEDRDKLSKDVERIKTNHFVLLEKLDNLEKEYAGKEKELQKKIGPLKSKLLEIEQSIIEKSDEINQTQDDLARRKLAMDDWEKNLTLREKKVMMGEDRLQQNNDLLNL